MESKKDKKEKMVTPIGEAKWAWLDKPKQPFKGDGQAKYCIDVYFDQNDDEWKEFINEIKKVVPAGKKVKSPVKHELDENDTPTGKFYLTFRTSAKYQPPVYDLHGERLTVSIGNGSRVKIACQPNYYEGFGGGINLYLNAVQVIDLVERQSFSASAFGFEESAPEEQTEVDPF